MPAQEREFLSQRNRARMKKISLANFSIRTSLVCRAEVVRFQKGEPNGLESTKNRRSAGWHGNQHVYVRDPQVSGERLASRLAQVDTRAWHVPDRGAVS